MPMSDTFIAPSPNESPAKPSTITVQQDEDVRPPSAYERGVELASLDDHVTEKLMRDRDEVRRCLEDLYAERETREALIRRLEEVESRLSRAASSTRGDDEEAAASSPRAY